MKKLQTHHMAQLRVSDSIKTKDGSTIPVIDGICSLSEVVSPNGYRYKKTFWDKVFAQDYVQDMITNRTSLGTVEHPEDDEEYLRTSYEKASHVCISGKVVDTNPNCKFGLLNNPKGNSIKALIDLDVPVGVSTRGLGDTLQDSVSSFIDEDNYALITWDIVKNPNFADLKLQQVTDSLRNSSVYKELVDAYSLRDSGDTDFKESILLADIDKALKTLQAVRDAASKGAFQSITNQRLLKSFTKIVTEPITDSYLALSFTECKDVKLPDNLKVEGTFTLRDCSLDSLPGNLVCDTLDIRGTQFKTTKLPDSIKFTNLRAQGSNITSLPKTLSTSGLVNITDTKIDSIPEYIFIEELRCSDSVDTSKAFITRTIKI